VAALFVSLLSRLCPRPATVSQTELVFEGKVVVLKDIGFTPEGARSVIVTFRVVRAVSGLMPKYVIVETRIPPAPDLAPGMLCMVRATAGAGDSAETLAPAIVCGLRDARISVTALAEGPAAA
jgi:hypothetical protein